MCPCRYNLDTLLELLVDLGKESASREFNPSFRSVRYDVDSAEFLRLGDKFNSHIVKFLELFGQGGREFDIGIVDQFSVGGQKRGTQDSIIPIENDTSLTSLWLIFGLEPDFLFSELIMERIPDLLVTPRS